MTILKIFFVLQINDPGQKLVFEDDLVINIILGIIRAFFLCCHWDKSLLPC